MLRFLLLALLAVTMLGCGSNLDAWSDAHERVYSRELRRSCNADRVSRQEMRRLWNVVSPYSSSDAATVYRTYRVSYGYTEDELHFCEGRDLAQKNPETTCGSFEYMRPSEVSGGVAFLLGSFDYCLENRIPPLD